MTQNVSQSSASPDLGSARSQPPALSDPFISLDAAAQYAHDRQKGQKDWSQTAAFILKHAQKNEFRVTLPATPTTPFNPDDGFARNAQGAPQLPTDFDLVGLYYGVEANLAEWVPFKQGWLYENFFDPGDLFAGLYHTRRVQVPATAAATLFLGCPDGALLGYQSRNSDLEQALFPTGSAWQTYAEHYRAPLFSGESSTRQFVQLVSDAGLLRVIQTSRLWNRPGQVISTTWTPFAGAIVPTLSPAFLSADDAARHVQNFTLGGTDQEMGGLIFQHKDGTFVASLPLATGQHRFDPDQLYPRTETGISAYPDDHIPYAIYRAHASLGSIREQKREPTYLTNLPPQERDLALRSFSSAEVLSTLLVSSTGASAFYALLSDFSIIKYLPSGSAEEGALLERLLPAEGGGNGKVDEELQNGRLLPSDFVKQLAKAQGLHVVRGNSYWGPPGQVPSDWQPASSWQPTTPPPLPLGPLFASADEAARYLNEQAKPHATDRQVSLILEHQGQERFTTSDPAKEPPALPDGFARAGLHYRAALYPTPLPPGDQHWLYRNMFTATDLEHLLPQAKGPAVDTLAEPLYLSTPDGALLKYRDTQARPLLLTGRGDKVVQPSVGAQLAAGHITPTAFVHALSGAGELSVLHPSEIWDRDGPVTQDWAPYQHFAGRALGPLFIRADDAARHACAQIRHRHDQAFGGLILQRPDKLFVATDPWRSPTAIFDHELIFPQAVRTSAFPEGHTIVGVYNSRRTQLNFHLPEDEAELYRNLFPTWDTHQAIKDRASIPQRYFASHDGALIRYTASGSEHEKHLFKTLSPASTNVLDRADNPLEKSFNSREPANRAAVPRYARDLLQAGELHVLVPGKVWVRPGIVTTLHSSSQGFTASNGEEAANAGNATDFPSLSPVFINVQDAFRHALAQVETPTDSLFGFVFRNNGQDEFVSTAPVADGGSGYDRYRVFPENYDLLEMISEGYDFEGVYVTTPPVPDPASLKDDPIYRHFLAPTRFAQLIGLARSVCPPPRNLDRQASVNLYLHTADGALLSYKVELFPRQDETTHLGVFSQHGALTLAALENASLSALDYVRQVAASGKLRVLRPGTFWHTPGIVPGTWAVKPPAIAMPIQRYTVSPLFTRADDAARHVHRTVAQQPGGTMLNVIYEAPGDKGYVTLEPHAEKERVNALDNNGTPASPTLKSDRLLVTFGQRYALDSLHGAHDTRTHYRTDTPWHWARDFFSSTDICFAIRNIDTKALYLSTLEGALLKYRVRASTAQSELCDVQPEQGDSTDLQKLTLPDATFVNKVAATGSLRVLVTDDFWQTPGAVDSAWAFTPPGNARDLRDLAQPFINTFIIGGIGATDVIDPTRALPVVIASSYLQPRDRIDLYWGDSDEPVASHTQGAGPTPSHITLGIPTSRIVAATPGWVTVKYVFTPYPGGIGQSSELRIRTKLTVPGAPSIDTSAEADINEKLELPEVRPSGVIENPENVSVVIRRYDNMFQDDSIVVSWHGRLVEHPPLLAPSDEVSVSIPPDIIREVGSQEVKVRYEIRDEVNNWSRWSRPALVEVALGDLPAPVVPRAQGMTLDLDALAGDEVETLVLRYEGMSSQQNVRLQVGRQLADGTELPVYQQSKPGDDSAGYVSFSVPNEQFPSIVRGLARFYYHVDEPGQPSRRSRTLPLRIIGQSPTLNPPRVPVAEANGNVLDPSATGVVARVEAYSTMALDQTVTLIWLGTTANGEQTRHDQALPVQAVGRDIDFTIPDERVSELAGGSVVIRYEVTPDQLVSRARLLPVSARPLQLPRPEVLEADGTLLFPLKALQGATVQVRYGEMDVRDQIQPYWRGTAGNGTPIIPAKPGSASGSVDFAIPVTAVSANIGKPVTVGYTVTRNGTPAPSPTLPLQVLPIAQDELPRLFVRQALNNRILDLSTFSGDATIEIMKWPHIQLGQRVWLHAQGTLLNGTPHRFTLWNGQEIPDAMGPFDDPVPRRELDKLKHLSSLIFTFRVTFDGSQDETSALTFPELHLTLLKQITPELVFDTSPVTLDGKIYLLPCHPQVLPAFGPGTTVQRQASGGVPGYHYSSDNPAIAVVDSRGTVTVRANGGTRIRVADRAGQVKSYAVTVRGVVQCYNLGVGTIDEIENAASRVGLTIPTQEELSAIRRLYAGRWPLQSAAKPITWSSTSKLGVLINHQVTLDMTKQDSPVAVALPVHFYKASGLGIGPLNTATCITPINARALDGLTSNRPPLTN